MSQLSVPLTSPSVEVVGKADMKEPSRYSTHAQPMVHRCYNSGHWYNKFIGYLKPMRTLNHADIFTV